MANELTISQAARNMFQDGIDHVAQQKMSRFRELAIVKSGCTGKSQAHRKMPKTEMSVVTGRLQPTVGQEQEVRHRYLFPGKHELATLIDEDDAQDLDFAFSPSGEATKQHQMAAARRIDKIFLDGIVGTNFEGEEGSIQNVVIPNSQKVAIDFVKEGAASNSGLTLAKLIEAKSKFGKNEVYGQDQMDSGAKLCMAVSQDELDDLLFDVEQTGNADYNKVRALVDGEVNYFMGIHFMRTQLLSTTDLGGNKLRRDCPVWTSDGVHLDFWYDLKTSIDILPQQSQAIQVYSRIKLGAIRHDEDRVVLVSCEQDS